MQRRLFCVWFGDPMSPQRQACFDSLRAKSGVELVLVTDANLEAYVPKDAIHPAFKYLSANHKSDYTRSYLMYHYGCGYSDIKQCHDDWNPWFDALEQSDKWCMGFTESPGGPAVCELDEHCQDLIGAGHFIFKPRTELAQMWYRHMLQKMDEKQTLLERYPAVALRHQPSSYPYPLEWAELMSCIFHPIVYQYRDKVLHGMRMIDTWNYL